MSAYRSSMRKLEGFSTERLRTALDAADTKAGERLMVATHTVNVSEETLAERYGIPRSTNSYWLEHLEKQPLAGALRDEPRQGRPPKLSSE